MPSLSFFKKRKSRDRQNSSTPSARDDSRLDLGGENTEPKAHGADSGHATGEASVAGTGASGHSSGAGTPIVLPDDAKNVAKEDEKTKARLAQRSSTRELIRGFLGHSPRGHRKDLDTGRSSPSWTSRSAASTPLPEYRPLRSEHESEHEHQHQHQHQHGPELGTEHKLGHGFARERGPESEPKHAATSAATATTTAPEEAPAQPSPTLREKPSRRARPVSAIAAASNTGSSLPGRWKSQRLKRLQSLAFRPRDRKDKDKETDAPQVTVPPATAVSHLPSPSLLRVLLPSHLLMPPSHRPTVPQTPGSRRLSGTPHSKVLPQIISPCRRRLPQHYLPMSSPPEPMEFWRVPFSRLHQPLAVKWIIPVIYILLLYMNLATPSRDHLSAGHRFSFSFPSVPASRSLNRTMHNVSALV